MSDSRDEIRALGSLAIPVTITQVGMMMLGVVDTLMVGRVGVDALAAAALGHIWTLGTLIFAMGAVYGMDPLVTQAHGARDPHRLGLALHRGLITAVLVSIPITICWYFTREALVLLGQDLALAEMAGRYVRVQLPTVAFFMIYTALRSYLQGRGIVRPALVVAVVANVLNVFFNWTLIFGNLGMPALGITGAGAATGLTRVFMCLSMLVILFRWRLLRGGWIPWSRESFAFSGIREMLGFGLPVGLQFSLEVWAFQICSLLAGRIGTVELAAHTIVLNMASLTFMVPLGVSIAAVTRVGNLIGAGDPQGAQRSAWIAIRMGAGVMAISASLMVLLRSWLPRLYTTDPSVIGLGAAILPVAAAFQLFDGIQVVGCGVLRGMGSTRPAALFNLLGYYVLALPAAWWLAFHTDLGLAGLWWGLALGLMSVAVFLVVWISCRGPAHAIPVSERLGR